jgi:hypothetical protein
VYPSIYTTAYQSGTSSWTTDYTCTFDSRTAQLTCSDGRYATTTTYGSLAYFVDEGEMMGRVLATREDHPVGYFAGDGARYYYDANRRLSRWESFSYQHYGGSTTNYVIAGWDTYGRPTAGTAILATGTSPPPAPGPDYPGALTCAFTVSYDDVSRTITWSMCPGFATRTETYDGTFFLSTLAAPDVRGGISTSTNTVNSTFKVCK